MRIALVTYHAEGIYARQLVEDDQLIDFLASKDLNLQKVVWNDPDVLWHKFDLLLIKSPWDYFDHIDAFYQWLDQIDKLGIQALNPVEVLRWNADKRYLNTIAAAGLKIVPSLFPEQGTKLQLKAYFDSFNCQELVVKPVVSGGSKHTFRINPENMSAMQITLDALSATEAFIVQPFLPEIEKEGEWSFIFFGGRFSHALIKRAKAGDFRVQESHGGSVHVQAQVTAEAIEVAATYVRTFAKDCLYARVDGVFIDGEFHLIELELIEPFLFLNTMPDSYENYYLALKSFMLPSSSSNPRSY